ncbi:MAG: hypothetical protein R6V54_02885, partial [Desulfobacteraceae bacterium]
CLVPLVSCLFFLYESRGAPAADPGFALRSFSQPVHGLLRGERQLFRASMLTATAQNRYGQNPDRLPLIRLSTFVVSMLLMVVIRKPSAFSNQYLVLSHQLPVNPCWLLTAYDFHGLL